MEKLKGNSFGPNGLHWVCKCFNGSNFCDKELYGNQINYELCWHCLVHNRVMEKMSGEKLDLIKKNKELFNLFKETNLTRAVEMYSNPNTSMVGVTAVASFSF